MGALLRLELAGRGGQGSAVAEGGGGGVGKEGGFILLNEGSTGVSHGAAASYQGLGRQLWLLLSSVTRDHALSTAVRPQGMVWSQRLASR